MNKIICNDISVTTFIFFSLDPSRIVVRLGAHNLSIPNEPDAIDVEVEEVRRHEQFESRTYKNDIAVLKLRRPVSFTRAISPVCLPYDSLRGQDLTQKSVIVIGYGTTAFSKYCCFTFTFSDISTTISNYQT